MNYPMLDQVESANREQIYKWFLLLPCPRLIRDKKTKMYFEDPPDSQEIMNRIVARWHELGGTDRDIADKILWEEYGTSFRSNA